MCVSVKSFSTDFLYSSSDHEKKPKKIGQKKLMTTFKYVGYSLYKQGSNTNIVWICLPYFEE